MSLLSSLIYLRLKLVVILLRVITNFKARAPLRRDRLLAESRYSIRRRRLLIPSRDPGRNIAADLYLPSSLSSLSAPASAPGPAPVLLNFHGSGFVLTNLLGTNSLFCARAAHDLAIPVLDVDYRKAPEHPFPAALHDVEDLLRWVRHPVTAEYSFDASRMILSGFSSGACLALAASLVLRKDLQQSLGIEVRGAIAFYPFIDLRYPSKEKLPPRDGIAAMAPSVLDLFVDCYLPDRSVRATPHASPSQADPAEYPETVAIMACEGDRLAAEALALKSRLEACRSVVNVVGEMLMGVGHGFDAGAKEGSLEWGRREEMYALAVDTARQAIGKV